VNFIAGRFWKLLKVKEILEISGKPVALPSPYENPIQSRPNLNLVMIYQQKPRGYLRLQDCLPDCGEKNC